VEAFSFGDMAALSRPRKYSYRRNKGLWFRRLMAIIALINLMLVTFDVSYIRFRDVYLRLAPEFTIWYGETFKGIEPERTTTRYLETVDLLEEQVAQTGLDSIQARAILSQLQQQSISIIDENPFEIADKSGTLELIKKKMRDRIGTDSAKDAFLDFWSTPYLGEAGWPEEIGYFNSDVQPLFETNYFRGIGIDGGPIDLFWKIDIWFIALFALELLARGLYLSRRYKNLTMLDAVLWRWYDLLLIIPFSALRLPLLGLSRVLPVLIRLNQAQLVNLEPLQNRINRFFISQVAVELTEIVVLRIIDQMQNLIQEGNVAEWLLSTGTGRRYIDINGVNELQVISKQLTNLVVNDVVPQLKPEIDALLGHSVTQVLDQSPAYKGFRQIPGIGGVPDQIAHQIVNQVSENAYDVVRAALQDDKGAQLTQTLLTKLADTMRTEVQKNGMVDELEALTTALLEEIKLNYVRRLAAEDYDRQIEQRYQIYNVTQESQPVSDVSTR
jgi:hypothetical protein